MALDQSALLDLLAELKLTDVPDRIRVATETLPRDVTVSNRRTRHAGDQKGTRIMQTMGCMT